MTGDAREHETAAGVLGLRPAGPGDDDALFRWQNDPDGIAMAAFTPPDPADRAAFDAHRARVLADPGVLHRTIVRGDEPVGMVATFPMDGETELTYWIATGLWGRGIATRAVGLFLRDVDPRRPIRGRVAAHNTGSQRVLEHLGFVRYGSDVGYAEGVHADVTEYLYRLD